MNKLTTLFVGLMVATSCAAEGWQASVAKYKDNKACAISYTFDDGLKEHYTMVGPEFEKRGMRATFFINGNSINQDDAHIADTTRMTWAHLRELSDRGHEISNHGWAHKNFARFPIEEIREDIEKNDSAILACTGKPALTFCYPNNNKKAEGRRISDKGRVGTRTFQRSLGSKSNDKELAEWTQKMIDTHDWGVTMTHGITYGYDNFGRTPQRLWKHLDMVASLKDKIWVGTFYEVAAYTAERRATSLGIARPKENLLLITPTMRLDPSLFVEPLTLVIQGDTPIRKLSAKQGGKKLSVTLTNDGKALVTFNPNGGVIEVKVK